MRQFQGLPTPVEVPTKVGVLEVSCTGANWVFVQSGKDGVTLRGVQYYNSCHFYLCDDGTLSLNAPGQTGRYFKARRVGDFRDASDAANRDLLATYAVAAAYFVGAYPDKMREGALIDVNNDIWRAQDERDKVQAKLDDVNAKIKNLETLERQLKRG